MGRSEAAHVYWQTEIITELPMEQLFGGVRVFMLHWAKNKVISGEDGETARLVAALSTNEIYLFADGKSYANLSVMSREQFETAIFAK